MGEGTTSKMKAVATNRRRLMQEARELSESAQLQDGLIAAPLEDDLFEWHWTVRGPEGTEFEGGLYHGRLILPPEYPFKPPELYLLTPSGRFEINTKVCLSISSFHPETWQPSWGIRTALIALTAFFGSDPKGAVGSLDAPKEERKRLAKVSKEFKCAKCGYEAKECPLLVVVPSSTEREQQSDVVMETNEKETSEGVREEAVVREEETTKRRSDDESNKTTGQVGSADLVTLRQRQAVPASSSTGLTASHLPQHHQHHHHHQEGSAAVSGAIGDNRNINNTRQQRQQQRQQQQQVVVVPLGAEPGHQGRAGLSGGGDPLWTDRAILVVLLALVACVVRKIA